LVTRRRVGSSLTAKLPLGPEGGREDFFGLGGLRAHFVAHGSGALHDVIRQRTESLDLDRHHVARLDGT
jgi:hypothetical protein